MVFDEEKVSTVICSIALIKKQSTSSLPSALLSSNGALLNGTNFYKERYKASYGTFAEVQES